MHLPSRIARRQAPEHALFHPLFWVAVAVLVLDDRVLKGSGLLPGVVTGKLSDFAGLFFAPWLLATLLRAKCARARIACHVGVGAVFSAIKLSLLARALWLSTAALFGLEWHVVLDSTDLLALPMLPISLWVLSRERDAWVPSLHGAFRKAGQGTALVVGLIASLGSEQARPPKLATFNSSVLARTGEWFQVLDLQTGTLLRTQVRKGGNVGDPPAIRDDMAYLPTVTDGTLSAVDIMTGKTRWTVPHPIHPNEEIVVADDVVILGSVGSTDGVDALRRWTGEVAWKLDTKLLKRPVVADKRVILVDDKGLVALDSATGVLAWKQSVPGVLGSPIIAGTRIFVGTADGKLWSLDVATGKILFSLATAAKFQEDYTYPDSALAASEDTVFYVEKSRLVALDVSTQKERWSVPSVVRVVFAEGVLIAVLPEENVASFDPMTGAPRWRVHTGWPPYLPIVSEGVVVLRSDFSRINGYAAKTGDHLWSFDVEKGKLPAADAGKTSASGPRMWASEGVLAVLP